MAIIIGTDDDDILEPGPGDDTAFMLDGDDRFIWNPGDGNDIVHGGGGADTLEFNGSEDVETFTISGDDTGVELLRDVGDIQMTLDEVETIELNALGGDDVIDASELLASNVSLIVNGGTGDDDAVLGAGDDTFVWNPGDGNDIVDGQDGTDTLLFNGADAAETFTISDTQVLRDVGNIQIDFTTLERIEVNGLGSDDVIDAGDVTESVELVADGGPADGAWRRGRRSGHGWTARNGVFAGGRRYRGVGATGSTAARATTCLRWHGCRQVPVRRHGLRRGHHRGLGRWSTSSCSNRSSWRTARWSRTPTRSTPMPTACSTRTTTRSTWSMAVWCSGSRAARPPLPGSTRSAPHLEIA